MASGRSNVAKNGEMNVTELRGVGVGAALP